MKYEKPQAGNPHKLTIRQHIIPVRSIERFKNIDGTVEIQIAGRPIIEKAKPNSWIFYTRRTWDQRAEHGYMKKIEDGFQEVADKVLSGHIEHIGEEHAQTVNRFYALWHQRSRVEPTDEIDTQISGITGQDLTQDEQEILEKKHILFVRSGGKVPTRHITGIQLQAKINNFARQIEGYRWGVIQTMKGQFVMPDVPSHNMMPIAPTVMLAAQHPNGTILKPNLIDINAAFLAYSRKYFFARDIQTALAGVTKNHILKAVKERDAQIKKGIL